MALTDAIRFDANAAPRSDLNTVGIPYCGYQRFISMRAVLIVSIVCTGIYIAMRVAMQIIVRMAEKPLAAAISPSSILKSIWTALNRSAAMTLMPTAR